VKDGWRSGSLASVSQLISRGISPAYVEEGGIAILNQKCVRNHAVNIEVGRRHNLLAKSVSTEKFVRLGDVLVNSTGTGTLGRVGQIRDELDEPTTVDSHVTIVRPLDGLFHPSFFGYALVAIEKQLQEGGEGCGGQTELSRSKLANDYRVSFPEDQREQQRIVAILDEAFDGIAKAKANAEKNLRNAGELFASYAKGVFVEGSERWPTRTLDQISTNLDSKRIPITKSDREAGEYPYYGASGIVDYVAHYIFDGDALLVSEDGANLLARSTPIAFSVSGRYWVNNHAHILKFDQIATQRFVEFFLESIPLDEYITGAAQPKLNQRALNSILIPVPEAVGEQLEVVNRIQAIAEQADSLCLTYQRQISCLDELKQSLLHRAFNGEL
jgi:type I restriction enzyme S subunit